MPFLKNLPSTIYHLPYISIFINWSIRKLDNKQSLIFANVQNKWKLENGNWKINPGFTLIELLIVISIIALLVAAASVSWKNAQEKGRDGRRKTDLKAVQQALEIYLQTNGNYPASDAGKIKCNVGTDDRTIEWSNEFSCDPDGSGVLQPTIYTQQLPKDPVYQFDAPTGYFYQSCGTPPLRYVLFATIENTNDPDINVSNLPSKCTDPAPVPGVRNYWAVNP